MAEKIGGFFEIDMKPQSPETGVGDASIQRLAISKQYHGPLEGTSAGQMLAVRTDVKGSSGYVAMERFTGTLNGRTGSFVLQHSGTMSGETQLLEVAVIPDSGEGALQGIRGTMSIDIVDGAHRYEFTYELPSE